MNIVLIGMPSSGKSTLGVLLAKRLGLRFVDSDLLIQESEGKLLHQLISEHGNEGFLEIENRVNENIEEIGAVIATGGSVIYRDKAMQHLKTLGKIVYLQLPYEVIERRLGDLKKRGVALKDGFTLKDLYDERTPLYEKYADVVVDLEGNTVMQAVEKLAEVLSKCK